MDLYKIRNELTKGTPLTSISLRVTDYARVSTDHLEQKKSLQNQTEHFEEYIKSNPNWTYIEGYVDDGITGTSTKKRENFLKMIDDAKNGLFDLIITKEISRFSRNTLDSIKYTRLLLSYGVAVLFVSDNINTALPDSELRLTIMASMAQDEIRRLSYRVKFGMNRAIEKGEILGNDLLYGYKKDKVTGNLKIIKEEADVVKRIYELYTIDELSLSKIAKTLNTENVKTSLNKKWNTTTISRMIENPKYKGYYCAHKSEIVDYMTKEIKYFNPSDWVTYEDKIRVPQIIEEDLWLKANVRLNKRKKSFKERKQDKTIYKNRYLYSAKIFCKNDKQVFYRRQFRKIKADPSWVCSEYLKNGKNSCNAPNIRESELTTILKDIIKKLEINTSNIKDILMEYYMQIPECENNQLKEKEKEIKNVLEKKEKLLALHLEENITKEEFTNSNNNLNEKLTTLQKEYEKLKELENMNNKNQNLNNLEAILNEKINSSNTTEKIIQEILDYIEVSSNTNEIILDIYLTYNQNENILINTYEFTRGYDTTSTKRYKVYYKVNCYT